MFTRSTLFITTALLAAFPIGPTPAHAQAQDAGNSDATAEFSIVNGQQIPEDTYPEVVQLLIPTPRGGRQLCTGTIINEHWVLSAAHCFDGIHDDAKPGILTYFHRDEQGEPIIREFPSGGFFVHPWFRLKNNQHPTLGNEYDVALVRMDEPLEAPAGGVVPHATLASPTDVIPTRGRGIVTGRGTYKFEVDPANPNGGRYIVDPLTARQAEVPITVCADRSQVCMNRDLPPETFPYAPTDANLHGNRHRQPSVCFGDSGGPLFIYEGNVRKQVGIANLMPTDGRTQDFYKKDICGRTKVLYTGVGFVQPWIQRIMQGDYNPGDQLPAFQMAVPRRGATASAKPSGGVEPQPQPTIRPTARPTPRPNPWGPGNGWNPWYPQRYPWGWYPPRWRPNNPYGYWSGVGESMVAHEEPATAAKPYVWTPPSTNQSGGSDLAIGVGRLRQAVTAQEGRNAIGTAKRAILASENHMADSLASGALQAHASLYLTNGDQLEDDVLKEFKAREINEVWLLGGPEAMSPKVEGALTDAGIATHRIAGADRVETATAIATFAVTRGLTGTQNRYVARAFGEAGNDAQAWADSLALGALAAKFQTPVVLTDTDVLSAGARGALAGAGQTTIIGGKRAVSEMVADQVRSVTGVQSARIGGATRTHTATAIAREFGQPSKLIVIDGEAANNWQLGFTLAGLAADLNAPVVLTNGQSVPAETRALLNRTAPEDVICIGSTATCKEVAEQS